MEPTNQTQYPARMRRRRRRRLGCALAVLLVLAAAAVLLLHGLSQEKSPETEPNSQSAPPQTAAPDSTQAETSPPDTPVPDTSSLQTEAPEVPEADDGWKLLLVNADHPLPAGYTVTLKELRNGHRVDERIYPELQQMFDDARAAGIHPLINESYRTAERQQQIMDSFIARYEREGLSHDEAVNQARTVVALPGTSEHELGLALDIIAEFDADSTATWQWLLDNSWRYGFILRYPAEKEEMTGISYEPWHFRYVGTDAARQITEQGLCLEEYLAQRDSD